MSKGRVLDRPGTSTAAGLAVVGRPVPRIDALAKVTGQQQYLHDLELPGLLYGAVLRSPHAHARIVRVDASRARELPGVRAVLTGADVPPVKYSFIPALADKYILCREIAHYAGDEVAAVAADTPEIAAAAVGLIEVEYEPLPAVLDPEEALKEGAPLVHPDKGTNLTFELHQSFGDVEQGFAESDFVFEDRIATSKKAHCCLETRGCIAQWLADGSITLWSPTQAPHVLRQELARTLGIPRARVRILSLPIGGAFGSKSVMDTKEPIAALLSRQTNRPVKMVNSREEEFIAGRTRYPYIVYLKTGVSRDGRILAKQARVIADDGAYNDRGPSTLNFAGIAFSVLYDAPHVKYDGYLVYTNKQPGTAFRGFGNPQVAYAFEVHLDRIAAKLRIDPLEIRLRNANQTGNTIACNAFINTCAFKECLAQAAELADYRAKKARYDRQGPDAKKRRGIGIGHMVHTGSGTRYYGYGAADTFIKVSEDGVVTVTTPVPEIGQGGTTAIAQIVAEGLGVKVSNIRIVNNDTDQTCYDLGAIGSREIFISGNAALAAAKAAREEIFQVAARMLNCSPEALEAREGLIRLKFDPESPTVTFAEAAEYAVTKMGRPVSARGRYFDELAPTVSLSKGFTIYVPTYTFGTQIAEVEVDLETGQVRVLNMAASHDTGRTVNPLMAEGQIEGSLAQGIGWALTEECRLAGGVMQNASFTDYKILHAEDMPEMRVGFVETDDSLGPFGAKGIGETGLVPTAAAVANAVFHATGLEIDTMPLTPEKILKALDERREK